MCFHSNPSKPYSVQSEHENKADWKYVHTWHRKIPIKTEITAFYSTFNTQTFRQPTTAQTAAKTNRNNCLNDAKPVQRPASRQRRTFITWKTTQACLNPCGTDHWGSMGKGAGWLVDLSPEHKFRLHRTIYGRKVWRFNIRFITTRTTVFNLGYSIFSLSASLLCFRSHSDSLFSENPFNDSPNEMKYNYSVYQNS